MSHFPRHRLDRIAAVSLSAAVRSLALQSYSRLAVLALLLV
ncbi:hypothetical protein [Baaleninema sp.]